MTKIYVSLLLLLFFQINSLSLSLLSDRRKDGRTNETGEGRLLPLLLPPFSFSTCDADKWPRSPYRDIPTYSSSSSVCLSPPLEGPNPSTQRGKENPRIFLICCTWHQQKKGGPAQSCFRGFVRSLVFPPSSLCSPPKFGILSSPSSWPMQ